MNRVLLVFLTISISSIQTLLSAGPNVNIPDANFKAFCVLNYDTSGDGEISVSEAANITNTTMDCSNLGITDLTGIEAFTGIERFYCNDNQLKSLPIENNTALYYLNCSKNQLTALPDLSAFINLSDLIISENQLKNLPDLSLNTMLYTLWCRDNQLTNLPDLSYNTILTTLFCDSNRLRESSCNTILNSTATSLSYNPQFDYSVISDFFPDWPLVLNVLDLSNDVTNNTPLPTITICD